MLRSRQTSVSGMFGCSSNEQANIRWPLDRCLHYLQISRCTCGCRVRCGPVAHQQHGSVTADKLSEDENDVTGIHYGLFLCSCVVLLSVDM